MTFSVSEIKDSIGDNINRQSMHQSKAYPKLSPKEMMVFIEWCAARPFRPANITYRDWYEKEKADRLKEATLLKYVEEY